MLCHRLCDATWASLHAGLIAIPGVWKKDPKPLRRFVEAVVHVLRAGIAWADLPATFGEAGTACRRFRRWARKGLWDELVVDGIPTDTLATVMVDPTVCKAQRCTRRWRGGAGALMWWATNLPRSPRTQNGCVSYSITTAYRPDVSDIFTGE